METPLYTLPGRLLLLKQQGHPWICEVWGQNYECFVANPLPWCCRVWVSYMGNCKPNSRIEGKPSLFFQEPEHMNVSCFWMCAKLKEANISFLVSVCPHGTTWHPLEGFSW